MKLLARLIAAQIEQILKEHHSSLMAELNRCTSRLDESLNKIDIMIARSDARVTTINHMVDNCLDLSKMLAEATNKSASVVHENSGTLQSVTLSHARIEDTYAISVKALQTRCDSFQSMLAKEQENTADIKAHVLEVKQSLDHLLSASLRPNINVNHKL